MSASKNDAAVANQEGQFGSRVPGSEPLQTGGHKPGVLASESDRAPEFSAQTLPPGSAPANATYEPNPDLNNQKMYQKASETIQGADSSDVHTGLGHPGQGETSTELRHDGQHGRKKQGLGTIGLGTTEEKGDVVQGRDPEFAHQRNLPEDVPSGQRGNIGGPPAEERVPESAETVAVENKLNR
ncbi:hypothetical protein BU26DRAFT_525431 [Trematosphaeria pertusa]|uniref:Uncharacterized protein n=1 Tax=Trematosphaeria pertusa TaxID=390896 RepID=A0A6A6HUL3_9PLEO|nr:uncharacterized protein BU26DRAFT_525431 [Trematosphaeria pertusa]KAF2241233.1 hypothetical protein BU26DRAFT_525431 [Trematosphaeria pertusa]